VKPKKQLKPAWLNSPKSVTRRRLRSAGHDDQNRPEKLIDAGAVDQVKADITKSFQAQLDEANNKNKTLEVNCTIR
jgi:hypothetical protein